MARVGRPRTQVDDGELVGAFARMVKEDREILLRVLAGVHVGLQAAAKARTEEIPEETPISEITQR